MEFYLRSELLQHQVLWLFLFKIDKIFFHQDNKFIANWCSQLEWNISRIKKALKRICGGCVF